MSSDKLDIQQIARKVFNTTTDTLRVDVTSTSASPDVNLHDGAGVVITSTSGAIDVQVKNASLPLPTGASTSALQTTTNSSLSSIDTKLPASLTVTATRLLVDSSGVTQPVSATSLPLPTGASTSALQTTTNSTLSSLDTKIPTLTIASTRLLVDNSGVTQPISSAAITSIDSKTPSLGQATSANSRPVVIASNQSTLPVSILGKVVVIKSLTDMSITNVTTSGYLQIVASTSATIGSFSIFNGSGEVMTIAVGAAASEVDLFYVGPGGTDGWANIAVATGSRVSIKSLTTTVSSGYLVINAIGI